MSQYVKVATDETVWLVANDGMRRPIARVEYDAKGRPALVHVSAVELESIPIRGQANDEEE